MEKSTAGFIGRQKKPGEKKRYGRGIIKENMQIYALMLPTLVLIFIFCYIPMYGLVIAFQDYVRYKKYSPYHLLQKRCR